MKKIFFLSVTIFVVPSLTFANTTIDSSEAYSLYCGSKYGVFENKVTVGKGKQVALNQGAFNQIQKLDAVSPNKYIKQAVVNNDSFSRENINKQCEEYLLKTALSESHSVDVSKNGKVLARVYFSFDKAQLTRKSKYVLNQLIKTEKHETSPLTVAGNTDSTGSKRYNTKLGHRRAKSVADYLSSHGISKTLLVTKSNGESKPIASNKTTAGRAKNRRTDIMIHANAADH
ncbi:OmpA family protein [Vibrio sp. S4M6]|uniref:OmpA family protein n=1 Tax=Vibrio sinus TaxID=2946865 RepID=UPI002029D343|nr:OmpA family protein [Vibrio sinus]MCL9783359.1 OmpA family protein [Vibrio sinus]